MNLFFLWLVLTVNPLMDWAMLAQEAYQTGNYHDAIVYYEVGIEAGFQSAELYFNLGNSYFELGDYGQALLYYRRAGQFSPRDETIQANIERIRALRRDYQQQSVHWGDYIADATAIFLRWDEMLWLGGLAWGYGCFLIGYGLVKPSFRRQRTLIVINFCIVGVILMCVGVRYYSTTYRPEAIITAPSAPVMSGASQDYLTLYTLYAGAELRIVAREGGWARLILPDGSSGWLNRFDFDYISKR